MADKIRDFEGGQSVNTKLTPNSNCVTTPSGDANDDTQCAFQYDQNISYWSPSVSSGTLDAINDRDRGNTVVRFLKGLTVTYLSQGNGFYTVTVDGEIKDSGTTYVLVGKSLGTFKSRKEAR